MARPVALGLLCGPPAAGKSTIATTFLMELPRLLPHHHAVYIEFDEVHDALRRARNLAGELELAAFNVDNWHEAQGVLRCVVQHVVAYYRGEAAPSPPTSQTSLTSETIASLTERYLTLPPEGSHPSDAVVVLVEDNFPHSSMRYQLFRTARKYGTGFVQLFVEASADACLRRNALRSGPASVAPEVIQRIIAQMELPRIRPEVDPAGFALTHHSSTAEGTHPPARGLSYAKHGDQWQRWHARVNLEETALPAACSILAALLNFGLSHPVPPEHTDAESASSPADPPEGADLDTALRRVAGDFLRGLPADVCCTGDAGQRVAALRKRVLADARRCKAEATRDSANLEAQCQHFRRLCEDLLRSSSSEVSHPPCQ
eukprot:EG_transcript_13753